MTVEPQQRLDQIVWADPGRTSGTPGFRGTRVPVQTLIDRIEGNATLEQFLAGFPSVTRQQAIEFIELGKESLLAWPTTPLRRISRPLVSIGAPSIGQSRTRGLC